MGLSHVGLGTEGGEAVGFGVWAVRVRARTARGLAGPAPGRSPRITRSTIGWRQHRRMAEPSAFIVVDTSAAVEMLVTEAESRIRYMTLFDQLRAAGYGIASSDVLLPELLEAAYTWDVRRSGGRDGRRLRRDGSAPRARARDHRALGRVLGGMALSGRSECPGRVACGGAHGGNWTRVARRHPSGDGGSSGYEHRLARSRAAGRCLAHGSSDHDEDPLTCESGLSPSREGASGLQRHARGSTLNACP